MQIITLNITAAPHLAGVIEQMKTLGAPKIAAIYSECHGAWVALEGSHRTEAAKILGLTPEIIEYEYDGEAMLSEYVDLDADDYTISEIFDGVENRPCHVFAD